MPKLLVKQKKVVKQRFAITVEFKDIHEKTQVIEQARASGARGAGNWLRELALKHSKKQKD